MTFATTPSMAMVPPRALVVDDCTIQRVVVRRMLERAGWVCQEAMDGQQALDRVLNEAFDVIVMDVCMPFMSGTEAAIAMSGVLGERRPPVVLLSTMERAALRRAAHQAGASGWARKPVLARELTDMVSNAVAVPVPGVQECTTETQPPAPPPLQGLAT